MSDRKLEITPRIEMDVIVNGDASRRGTISWEQGLLTFQPPPYIKLTIEDVEQVLAAMHQFKTPKKTK